MRIDRRGWGCILVAAVAGWAACGAPPATTPTPPATPPVIQPPPVVHVVNTAPTIKSISVSTTRTEVDQDVIVTAEVEDAETAPGDLTYTWGAEVGTFSGEGASVKWRLAKRAAATPVDVVVTLVVTERYQDVDDSNVPVTRENTVTGTSGSFRAHDSVEEISRISVRFLVDYFGNSSTAPNTCVIDFWDGCPGKNEELAQIEHNRANFLLLGATAKVDSVSLNPAMTSAEVHVSCSFHDRHLPDGREGTSSGDCYLTAVYQMNRWWLCDSHFYGTCGSCAGVAGMRRRMTMEEFFLAGLRKK